MDTDELTTMAYDCLCTADEAADVLMTDLGAASSEYETEDDYLRGILQDVTEIEQAPCAYLAHWALLDQMDVGRFRRRVAALRKQIEKTIATPFTDRGDPAC